MSQPRLPQTSINMNALHENVYTDFTGGINTDSPAIGLGDNEVLVADNVEFTRGAAFKKRSGTRAVNGTPMYGEVSGGMTYEVAGEVRTAVVSENTFYLIDSQSSEGTVEVVGDTHGNQMYPFQVHDTLFFTDGEEYWEYGAFDTDTDVPEYDAVKGTIVRFLRLASEDELEPEDDRTGEFGHFYMALQDMGVLDFTAEAIDEATQEGTGRYKVDFFERDAEGKRIWRDVTDVVNGCSNIFRRVEAFYAGRHEKVEITIKAAAQADGTIFFSLGTDVFEVEVVETETIGSYDVTSASTSFKATAGRIVKFTHATSSTGTRRGVSGTFYQARTNRGTINLTGTNFLNTTHWEVLWDGEGEIPAGSPLLDTTRAQKITKGGGGDPINIAQKIFAVDVDTFGWDSEIDGAKVTFTQQEPDVVDDAWLDSGETRIEFACDTIVQGRPDNNIRDLLDIRKCTMFTMHNKSRRIFACGNPDDPKAIYYSEINAPRWFAQTSKIYPTEGYGKLTALLEVGDSIVVSYERGWFTLRGETPDVWEWIPLNVPYGCVASRTAVNTPSTWTFLAQDAIVIVDKGILSQEYGLVNPATVVVRVTDERIERLIASMDDKSHAVAAFWDNKYFLAYHAEDIMVDTGEPDGYLDNWWPDPNAVGNNYILVLDWRLKSFTRWTGLHVNFFMQDGISLMYGTTNYVGLIGEGNSDLDIDTGDEAVIHMLFRTKPYTLSDVFAWKDVRKMGFIVKQDANPEEQKERRVVLNNEYTHTVPATEASGILNARSREDDSNFISPLAYKVNGFDLTYNLIWGTRTWGKKWGWRETMDYVAETSLVARNFTVELKDDNLGSDCTVSGIGFIFRETAWMEPENAGLLKDDLLWEQEA